jgi:sugar phosphate permease
MAAVAAQLSVSALQQGLPSLGPILQSTFDLDTAGTGLLLGIGSLGTAVAVTLWGRLTDHTSDRFVAIVGLLLTAGALSVAGFAASLGSLWGTAIGLIGAGLTAAAPTVALTKSVVRAFTDTDRIGLAFGVRQAAVPLGGVTAGLVLPLVALSISLAAALWTMSALLLLAAVLVALTVHSDRVRATARPPLGATPWRPVLPLFAASALYTATQIGLVSLLTLYLVTARDWSPEAAALAFSFVMGATIALRVTIGFAADRWPLRRMALFRTTGLITAVVLLLAAWTNPQPISVTLLIIASIMGMGWNSLAFTMTVSLVPADRMGTSQGALNAIIFTSWGLAPIVTSRVVEATSWPVAWVVLALLSVAGAFIARARLEPRRRSSSHVH